MSKKKVFAVLFVLMLAVGGMSFALENDDVVASVRSVASVLSFDEEADTPTVKVARKASTQGAVQKVENLPFITHEEMKHFQEKKAVINNTQIVTQAKRAINDLDMRFEEHR